MKTSNLITTKTVLFQIKDARSKIIKLIQTSLYHFQRKEPILIYVNDPISEKFVDELLWKQPKESFLPHVISDKVCSDFIVITKNHKNLNEAHFMFNLCPDIPLLDKAFKIIYDFDDSTSQKKLEFSKKRFDEYRKMGFIIESR